MGDKASSSASASMSTQILEEAKSISNKCRNLSQRAAIFCNRLVGESDALAVEVRGLEQAIKSAETATRAYPEPQLAAEVMAELQAAKDVIRGLGPGGDLRKFCKPKTPLMLRLLLGDKANLVSYRADQLMGLKDEYHKFRDRTSLIMIVVPFILVLGIRHANNVKADGVPAGCTPEMVSQGTCAFQHTFTPGLMTCVQLYFLWLSYFYLALALRENVLLVNGSAIKAWWIEHHYWSAGGCLLLLGLPVYSPALFMFCQYFLMWSSLQGIVMMFQNRYQRRRMYTRIAVGKSGAMDVVSGESSGTSGQLLILYPLLFLLQGTQFSLGAALAWKTHPALLSREGWLEMEAPGEDLRGMRGVCLTGLLFCFMAVQNFRATVGTILDKRRFSRHARRRSKQSSTGAAENGSGGKAKSG